MSGLAASRWALPSLSEFFASHVERLSVSKLSSDDCCCPICQEDFEEESACLLTSSTTSLLDNLPFPELKDNGVDEPLLLPCGHIYGSSCLQAWFSSSGSSSCPMCARSLFITTKPSPELEYGAKYHAIKALPLRELLVRDWNDELIVTLNEDVMELVGRLPRVMWKIAVRTLARGQDFPHPGGKFDMYDDDATNLHQFFDRHVFMLDGDDESDPGSMVNQPFAKLLLSHEAGVQYARVCRGLRHLAGQTMPAQKLYDELLAGDEQVSRVISLAVRAIVDMEQRFTDINDCQAEVWEDDVDGAAERDSR